MARRLSESLPSVRVAAIRPSRCHPSESLASTATGRRLGQMGAARLKQGPVRNPLMASTQRADISPIGRRGEHDSDASPPLPSRPP